MVICCREARILPRLKMTKSEDSEELDDLIYCDDDVESCCGESKTPVFVEFGSSLGENLDLVESVSLIGSKRSRRERIRTSVSIMQSIILGGICEGMNPVSVIDEAINYLKSLKVKAEALGFDAL